MLGKKIYSCQQTKKKKGKTDETPIPFAKPKSLENILFVKTQAVNEE